MNKSGQYVEFARFRTRPGVTHAQFLAAEEHVRKGVLKTFAGYLSRELYKNEEGEWTVVLRFTDKPSMDALLEKLKVAPDQSFKDYGGMIDRATMRADFFHMQM